MLRNLLPFICSISMITYASHDQLITEQCEKEVRDTFSLFERYMYDAITYGASDKQCNEIACIMLHQKMPLSTAAYNILHAFEKQYAQEVWREVKKEVPHYNMIERDIAMFRALPKPIRFSALKVHPDTPPALICSLLGSCGHADALMDQWYGSSQAVTGINVTACSADACKQIITNMNFASDCLARAIKSNTRFALLPSFPLYIEPVHTVQEAELAMGVSAFDEVPVFLAKVPANATSRVVFLSQLAHIHELHGATFPTAHIPKEPQGPLYAWSDQLRNVQTRIADALFIADDLDLLIKQQHLLKQFLSNHEKQVIAQGNRDQLRALYEFQLLNKGSLAAQRFVQSKTLLAIARYLAFRR
ncbi:MAG: hypothetical protein WCE21_04120 [Candidatus Babeliales bacterium]